MKNILIPVLLTIIISSCSKEKSVQDGGEVIDPIPQFSMTASKFQNSDRFLKREIISYINNPELKHVRIFNYGNSKRCTEIKLGTIDSSVLNPVFTLKQTLTFHYEGSSVLPSSFSSVRTVFPNLTTTFYYKYDDQGKKVKDSVRVKNMAGDPADRVINYVYAKDKVYTTPKLTGFPMENNSLDTLSILSGGNIEKLVSRMIKATGDQITTYSFTYDQAISPYNKLNIANSLYFEHSSLGIGYNVPLETHYMGVTTNNMSSWSSGNYKVEFNYVYDQYNYPVRKEMILPGDTQPFMVVFFEY